MQDGNLIVRTNNRISEELRALHDANREDTVSHLLLTLSGFADHLIRKNARGTTRTLSFRDVTRLILTHEDEIIKTGSPALSGRTVTATAEKSVFKLLLTGVDDSSIVESQDPSIALSRREGKIETLNELVQALREELTGLDIGADRAGVQERLEKIDEEYATAVAEVASDREAVARLEQERGELWRQVQRNESRQRVLQELALRYRLLSEQYKSDIHRLEGIIDASSRLSQLYIERCPVCGAPEEFSDHNHAQILPEPAVVTAACESEILKIRLLARELETAKSDANSELDELAQELLALNSRFEDIKNALESHMQPRIQASLGRLNAAQEDRDRYQTAYSIFERIESLEHFLQNELTTGRRTQRLQWPEAVSSAEAEEFCQVAEGILRSWNMPNLDRVTFSGSDTDLVISGRARSSHGKGVRALTHAAFNTALLRYCRNRGLPHPGVVLLDSPLVVYREPDAEESVFSPNVKASFFHSLAGDFQDSQVIIFENEIPPAGLDESANIVTFSGSSIGRRGFIPAESY